MNAQSLLTKIFSTALLQGFGVVSLIFLDLYLAKNLGSDHFGVYASISSWLAFALVVSTFGMNTLLLKFIPAYEAANNRASIKSIIQFSRRVTTSIALCIGIAAVIASKTIPSISEYSSLILLGFLSLPISAILQQNQSILRGLGFVHSGLVPEFLIKPVLMVLGITYLIQSNTLSLQSTYSYLLISLCITWGYSEVFLKSKIKSFQAEKSIQPETRYWLTIATPLMFINFLGFLSIKLDIVMLGFFENTQTVGVFSVASKISESIVFLLAASNSYMTPSIARLISKPEKKAELSNMLKKNTAFLFWLNLPLIIVLGFYGDKILAFLGSQYLGGYLALIILIAGQFVSTIIGPVGQVMMMGGYERLVVKIMFFCAAVNVALNLILIPIFGLIGTALSTSISICIINLVLHHQVKIKFGINTIFFKRQSYE